MVFSSEHSTSIRDVNLVFRQQQLKKKKKEEKKKQKPLAAKATLTV